MFYIEIRIFQVKFFQLISTILIYKTFFQGPFKSFIEIVLILFLFKNLTKFSINFLCKNLIIQKLFVLLIKYIFYLKKNI